MHPFYGCILKFLCDGLLFFTYSETVLPVSLLCVVHQPYRPRQELLLHLELYHMTVVELLNGWKTKQNIAHYL